MTQPHASLLKLISAACIVSCASLAQAQTEPIRIGALLSVTGGLAALGQNQREGVLLAQKIVNERGGVNGRKLEIIVEDDASSPDSAVPKTNALIHTQKVRAIIGPTGIAQSVAIGAITQKLNVPVLAFTGLGPAVEQQRTCVFHLTPAQELNARSMLSYARDHNLKKVGVLHDTGYGQVIWNAMKGLTKEYGVEVVQQEKFDIAATDATTQAAKVKAAAPDAVFVMSASPVPFRNVRQVKLNVPIISVHGNATYEIVKGMGDAADNIIYPEFLVAEDPQPNQKEFVEAYKKEYNRLPKHFSAMGWDAVMSLVEGLKATQADPSGEKPCAALRKPYQGATTKYDFSAPDMGGMTLAGFTYSKLDKGVFTRLPYKPAK